MPRIDALLSEVAREVQTTRKHLVRVPADRMDWRPHAKSFTVGELGAHLVDCLRWVGPTFRSDELDLDATSVTPCAARGPAELLEAWDAAVADAEQAMTACADREASQPWRLRMRGKVWFEKSREEVLRDMTLSHMAHHRGQLSVYLRLLDIPVPSTYGPTADER